MDEWTQPIRELLHEAGEVHHVERGPIVVRAVGDAVHDYTDWLIEHSELPETLGRAPTRSHLVHEPVESEGALAETAPDARWEDFYAQGIVDRFG
jgi:hypothetical protein